LERIMVRRAALTPIEGHLGYWLRFVSNHVSHAFGRLLAARDVTVAEWVVMRDLYERDEGVPSALAERLGLTRGAISKLADRLEAKGIVARTIQTEDRRYQSLSLTAAGRALVPELSAVADRNDAAFFGHLKPEARRAIAAAMKEIVRRHDMRAVPVE